MIGRIGLGLALIGVVASAHAQEQSCQFYKVNTSLLNISKDAGGGVYMDVLEDGEIACVTRKQKAEGRDWGYVDHKIVQPNGTSPVNGWATLRDLKPLSPKEVGALRLDSVPASTTAAPPPTVAAPAVPAAKAPDDGAVPALTIRPEDAFASDRRVSGTITEVDCGDGTNFAILEPNGKRLLGVCYENWCENLCAENAEAARNRLMGTKVSFGIRITNTEEPSSGSLVNEFYNMTLE